MLPVLLVTRSFFEMSKRSLFLRGVGPYSARDISLLAVVVRYGPEERLL